MPIELSSHQVPLVINWFNNFVGFREMYKRIERAEAKLRSIEFASSTLNKRYFFHTNYKRLIVRNRQCRKISLEKVENCQPISFITSIQDAARNLSEAGKARLRSQVLDALSPDRDIRALEHEMRVYTHFRQQECKVALVDLEGIGNHDFNIRQGAVEFEVEAKTLSEDIGNLVSTEDSVTFFRAYKQAIKQVPSFRESGILTYSVQSNAKTSFSLEKIADDLSDFIGRAVPEREYDDAMLKFQRRTDWEPLIQRQQFAPIREAIFEQQERLNPHAMIIGGYGQIVMFCVQGARPIRLFRGIRERLKHASSQLSGKRPGMIWMHYLGLDEPEFVELRDEAMAGRDNAFTSFGRYVFGSDDRKHVCRLRFSGESNAVTQRASGLFLAGPGKQFSQHGPAYDLISSVSLYDARSFG